MVIGNPGGMQMERIINRVPRRLGTTPLGGQPNRMVAYGSSTPATQTNLNLGPGFASAALEAKKRDLAVAQAQAAGELTQSDIGRNFFQAASNLEGNLEGRGILKSGEGNTARVALGAEEKAARAKALMNTENAINQANMDYASALAQAQAQATQTAPVTPVATEQRPRRPRRPGSGGGSSSTTPSTGQTPSTGGGGAPKPPTVTNTPVPVRSVGGRIVRPGDTPSETTGRGSRPPVRAPYAPKQPTNQFGRIRGGM